MKFNNVALIDWDLLSPPLSWTSADIENQIAEIYQKLRLSVGRLELFTGIQRRGFWPTGSKPSHLASEVGQMLLSRHQGKNIDLLLSTSVCRDQLEPATAMNIHGRLGLSHQCLALDLSNACVGFVNGMTIAASLIDAGKINYALVVSAENSGPLLEQTIKLLQSLGDVSKETLKKYLANFTIGSGAVAFLLGPKDRHPECPSIKTSTTLTDGTLAHLCVGDGNTHGLAMETDSEMLLEQGKILATRTFQQFLQESDLERNDFQWIIGHQVGKAHEFAVLQALEMTQCPTIRTYPDWGNTGSAALPLTLATLFESGKISPNDRLCLAGIGSGLSCSMMEILIS